MRSVFGIFALAAVASAAPSVPHGKIPRNYLVVFKPDVSSARIRALKADLSSGEFHTLSKPRDSFGIGSFKGFSGEFDAETVRRIAASPDVAYVEQEQVFHANSIVQQDDASWNLDRISHATLGPAPYQYVYDDGAQGLNTYIYVVDTGIYAEHSEFEGRAILARGQSDADCNGHGTYCAALAAGKTYGVAKKATVVGVKVLDCNGAGTTSGVIAGINWVAGHHNSNKGSGCVVNMALGGTTSTALNAAIKAASDSGCIFAVAAGHEGGSNPGSPGNSPVVISMGATDKTDTRATWSNYGPSLTAFAPGTEITSAWIGNPNAKYTISGTSASCPMAAGLISYILSLPENKGKAIGWDTMKGLIQKMALAGVVKNAGPGSPNFLINNGNR